MISVIIPVFNEQESIIDCLKSLLKQTLKDLEVLVIDDGSTDKTLEVLSEFRIDNLKLRILRQRHLGPGVARNLGAEKAKGEILVFVDADMTFDPNFITKLTQPIKEGKTIGTFSKQEYVLNKNNVWSKCWNINKNLPLERMHPPDYPDRQNVFRAVRKDDFLKSSGFEPIGYIDDHTLAEKLSTQAVAAAGAIFYHLNPDSLSQVYRQARWIGKSEFKRRKIPNELLMKLVTILRYSPPLSLFHGVSKSIKFNLPQFIIFKIIYDFAVEISVIKSFFGEQPYR